jgi:sugar/nucleoside kinase (ribokinase family)
MLRVDASFDPALLEHVTALKLSEEEAEIVAGGRFSPATAARLGVPEILVTLGSRGVLVFADGRVDPLPPARAVTGVQATGAGDAFMVAYAVSRVDGAGPVEAARAGCRLVAEMLEARKSRDS